MTVFIQVTIVIRDFDDLKSISGYLILRGFFKFKKILKKVFDDQSKGEIVEWRRMRDQRRSKLSISPWIAMLFRITRNFKADRDVEVGEISNIDREFGTETMVSFQDASFKNILKAVRDYDKENERIQYACDGKGFNL